MRDNDGPWRRAAKESSDDDLAHLGYRPTVSRFGAISRTSKAIYQGAGQCRLWHLRELRQNLLTFQVIRGNQILEGSLFTTSNTTFSLFTISALHNLQGSSLQSFSVELALQKSNYNLGNYREHKLKCLYMRITYVFFNSFIVLLE